MSLVAAEAPATMTHPAREPADARSWRLVAAEALTAGDAASSADVLVADLEDGTPEGRKDAARAGLAQWLAADLDRRVWVRVNGALSRHWADDVSFVRDQPGVVGVILAMAEAPDEVAATIAAVPVPVVALIESARGLLAAPAIAASGVVRVAFGVNDYARDIGSADPRVLEYARHHLTVASRAAGLPGPIDGPSPSRDAAAVRAETRDAAARGLTGRLCVADVHEQAVNLALTPTHTDVVAAQRLVSEPVIGYRGAVGPRLDRAREVLRRAAVFAGWDRR